MPSLLIPNHDQEQEKNITVLIGQNQMYFESRQILSFIHCKESRYRYIFQE